MFGWRSNKDQKTVVELAELAQKLILELRQRDYDNETFAQEGILDGLAIVENFIGEDEIGLAIEHLLYMIYESDISYPAENLNELHALVSKFKVNNFYAS